MLLFTSIILLIDININILINKIDAIDININISIGKFDVYQNFIHFHQGY